MTTKIKHYFKPPDEDAEYEELEEHEPKSIGTCCICNSNASMCTAERKFSSYITAATAQTVSYWGW